MNRRDTLCDYFDEDLVIKRRSNGKVVFGLVIESSENASDSEDSDCDTDDNKKSSIGDKWRQLKPGFTKIALYPNGSTSVVNESKVKLYDRSLLSGDVVQRLDPKSHKLVPNSGHGFCKSTKILAALKILGTDKVIENVDSNDLEMLSHISEDTICLLDSWLGYVKEVNQKITLKCMDGSLLTVDDLDISEFEDLLTQRENNDSEFNRDDYYIGQQLFGPKNHLKNGKWIKQTKQMKRFMNSNSSVNYKINVVVEDVTIDNVSINWLCCLSDQSLSKNKSQNCDTSVGQKNTNKNKSRESSTNDMSHPIGDIVRGEAIARIKCLNHFRNTSLQIGHQCYYTIKPTDAVIRFSDWETSESLKLSEEEKSTDSTTHEEVMDFESDNESDVETQENGCKSGLNSESLSLSSFETNEYKNKRKLKKTKTHFYLSLRKVKNKKLFASHRKRSYLLPINTSSGSRLPVEIMATNTRVTVVWQNATVEEDIPSVCLYPVHHIDNHDFFAGDYVIENKDISQTFGYGVVQKCDSISRTATVKWFSLAPDSMTPQFIAQQELSVYDIKDHPDFTFRSGVCVVHISTPDCQDCDPTSRAGQVVDLTLDGMLKCVWLNGQSSLVCPQHLFVVGDYDSDDLWGDSGSEYDYSDYDYYSDVETDWVTDEDNPKANNSAKKSSKSSPKTNSNNNQNSSLLNLLRNGATQLEEWLRNGSGSYRNGLQNLLKMVRKAESGLEKSNSNNDLTQKQSNYANKIQELSKRVLQLLPFTRTSQPIVADNNHIKNNETIESKPSSTDPQNASSSSDPNLNTFLELIDDLKTELLKNETKTQTQPINGETFGDKSEDNSSKCEEMEIKVKSKTNDWMEINGSSDESKGSLIFLDSVPECHKYYRSLNEPKNPKEFIKRIRFEISLLRNSLPEGISVALFEDRIDMLSVLVFGPKGTPYEDGLFLFDMQLPSNYPSAPPLVHYISYCSDRLNPNLYESGKVCISLLGTWSGKGTEVWAPSASNLLQVIISIQGLILVAEPYYNEAGYGRQKGTTIANDNSRLYNEMVVIKMIQSMTKMLSTPPKTFQQTIRQHIIQIGDQFIERHKNWSEVSDICLSQSITTSEQLLKNENLIKGIVLPPFPLLPASHGFCLSLNKAILLFRQTLDSFK